MKASEIQEGIQHAFVKSYAEIESAIYMEWPELTFIGAGTIMAALAANLWRYYHQSPDERFTRWATAWVRRQTRRHRFITELFNGSHPLVYAAVQRSLFACLGEDWSQEPADHEADVYLHLLQYPRKIDALLKPIQAKPTTMLYALTRSRMRAVRSKLTDRHALVVRRAADIACEIADPCEPNEREEKLLAVA